jgi:phage-related protein
LAKGKELSTNITLRGKVDPSLNKALSDTKSQASNAARAMSKSLSKNMTDGTRIATKAMTKSLKSVAIGAVKIFGAIKALAGLKNYASETLTAAKAQLEVQTKLSSVLENVKSIQIRGPNAAAEAAKELQNVADVLEKTGVIGSDVTLAGMQQLATYQLSEKEISVLSGGMADLLAQQKGLNASQSDAVSIGNLIGKAMSGNVGALSKVGISFSEAQAKAIKTGDATLRAATIAEVLKDNVGGVNKALGETDDGQLLQSKNTFDEIKEEIGYFLLPLLNKFVKGVLPYVKTGLENLKGVLDKLSPIISKILTNGFERFSTILPVIMDVISDILPIITQLITPMGGLKQLLPVIISAIQMLLPVIKSLLPTITNLIQKILPVLLTIFQKFIPLIANVVKEMAPLVVTVMDALIPAFETLIPPVIDIISNIMPVLISLFKMITPFIAKLVSQIAPLVMVIVGALMPAFQALMPPIMNLIESLLPVLMTLFDAVFSVIQSLAPVISVVAQVLSAILGAAIKTLIPIIQGIIGYFSNLIDTWSSIIDFVVNVFTGNWSSAWQNIKDIFSGIFRGFVDVAKAPLNLIIGLINSAINNINGLTSVINKIPGVDIGEIPQIPYLAKGATVSAPTLAMIGEGKVPETVVPHNNTKRSRALLAEAARGVGVKTGDSPMLSVINNINRSLSYFASYISGINKNKPVTGDGDTTNSSNSKVYNYYYSPVVNAKDASGVKEVLEDEFEKFKAFVKQLKDEEEREVFA